MNSAYSISESPDAMPRLSSRIAPAYPVVLGNFDRRNKIIARNLVPPASPPTKYRRPPRVDRDSFGGGMQGYSSLLVSATLTPTTSKAISRDCYRKAGDETVGQTVRLRHLEGVKAADKHISSDVGKDYVLGLHGCKP